MKWDVEMECSSPASILLLVSYRLQDGGKARILNFVPSAEKSATSKGQTGRQGRTIVAYDDV